MHRPRARWPRRAALLLILAASILALAAGPSWSQSGPPLLTINQVLSEQYPEVVSYVTVVNAAGLAVTGLTEADFTLREEGQPVTPFTVVPASQEGIQVIVALDASGSMLSGTALEDARAAARTFFGQLKLADHAALLVFAETAELVLDLTGDLAALGAAVDAVKAVPNARTALYEATFEASERLAQLPAGRKAIIILTDGADTVGGFSLKDAIDSAQEANVPVYTIGLLGGEFAPAPMRQLAESTGGFYLETPASADLTASFEAVRQLLEAQYAIRYTSPLRPTEDARELSIAVTVTGAAADDRQAFLPLPVLPWVLITSPAEGENVAGTVRVAVEAAARASIREVQLAVDGAPLHTLPVPPYRFDWDTAALIPGSHILSASVTDPEGNSGGTQVTVSVLPALSVALAAPADGSSVVGLVEIRPDVEAVRRVSQVTVAVDGIVIATLIESPYVATWDTAGLALGPHDIVVTAQDDAGAKAEASAHVQLLPALTLVLSAPAQGASVVGVVDVQPAIQAARPLREVQVSVDATPVATVPAPPYTYRWDTAELPPGRHQVQVSAVDETGATAQAQAIVAVQPVLTVQWLSPLPGDVLTATVALVAQAQAHYGVERVEFTANDQLLGAVKEPPFRLEWSTLNLEEPEYQLRACAFDVMGHRQCDGVTIPLKRPGPSAAMFLALGLLLVAVILVTVMVMRTRQRAIRPAATAGRTAPEVREIPSRAVETSQRDVSTTRDAPTRRVEVAQGAAAAPRAWFVITPPDGDRWEATLRVGDTTIGRASDSHIRLDDEMVSRQHAVVHYEPSSGEYTYRDQSPTNPSLFAGEEMRGPHVLRRGDALVLGSTTLTFYEDQ
jgi:VWFA-related protein